MTYIDFSGNQSRNYWDSELRTFGTCIWILKFPDSSLTVSILDANTNQVIPGFSNISTERLDLGLIDYKSFNKIKVRIDMEFRLMDSHRLFTAFILKV